MRRALRRLTYLQSSSQFAHKSCNFGTLVYGASARHLSCPSQTCNYCRVNCLVKGNFYSKNNQEWKWAAATTKTPPCSSKFSTSGTVVHQQEEEKEGQSSEENHSRRRLKQNQPLEDNLSWTKKLMYSSYLQQFQSNQSFRDRLQERAMKPILEAAELVEKTATSVPLSCKLIDESFKDLNESERSRIVGQTELNSDSTEANNEPVHYPYKVFTKTEFTDDKPEKFSSVHQTETISKFKSEREKLETQGLSVESLLAEMDSCSEEDKSFLIYDEVGTPDPKIPSSKVPCGGCGAHLHCQEPSIPGYMPSERFKSMKDSEELRGETCLRCYALEMHNTALNVTVSPEDYPKILKAIEKKIAMVVLLVDLTDFPCSIWPGIVDIIGTKRPVFLVGNKVDLLPRDSDNYLQHIRECMINTAKRVGLEETKIVHTTLISAETGFGVEDLITKIYQLWRARGDIYIMGCTNVGKSTLFNALVQSDMCKTKVVDLIQRSTISQWPGTTLNLLKFPIMRADPWRLYQRDQRLAEEQKAIKAERQERVILLKSTKNTEHSTLKGHIGRTFLSQEKAVSAENPKMIKDIFQVNPNVKTMPKISKVGQWDPFDPEIQGKWCYDTPGTVNENQILDILTLPELMKTLPKKLIAPRTYFIKVGMTMFIGGFARIDFIEGMKPIRYTTFLSDQVPITIVLTENADEVYKKALGTPVFGVPEGNNDRLKDFPELKPTEYTMEGIGHDCSCGDIVLSSAGWVAVTAGHNQLSSLRVYTPNGKGVFYRQPALLPYSVNMKGPRIRDTPAYLPHRVFIPSLGAKIY